MRFILIYIYIFSNSIETKTKEISRKAALGWGTYRACLLLVFKNDQGCTFESFAVSLCRFGLMVFLLNFF